VTHAETSVFTHTHTRSLISPLITLAFTSSTSCITSFIHGTMLVCVHTLGLCTQFNYAATRLNVSRNDTNRNNDKTYILNLFWTTFVDMPCFLLKYCVMIINNSGYLLYHQPFTELKLSRYLWVPKKREFSFKKAALCTTCIYCVHIIHNIHRDCNCEHIGSIF